MRSAWRGRCARNITFWRDRGGWAGRLARACKFSDDGVQVSTFRRHNGDAGLTRGMQGTRAALEAGKGCAVENVGVIGVRGALCASSIPIAAAAGDANARCPQGPVRDSSDAIRSIAGLSPRFCSTRGRRGNGSHDARDIVSGYRGSIGRQSAGRRDHVGSGDGTANGLAGPCR